MVLRPELGLRLELGLELELGLGQERQDHTLDYARFFS
jgi:hypothetical protein